MGAACCRAAGPLQSRLVSRRTGARRAARPEARRDALRARDRQPVRAGARLRTARPGAHARRARVPRPPRRRPARALVRKARGRGPARARARGAAAAGVPDPAVPPNSGRARAARARHRARIGRVRRAAGVRLRTARRTDRPDQLPALRAGDARGRGLRPVFALVAGAGARDVALERAAVRARRARAGRCGPAPGLAALRPQPRPRPRAAVPSAGRRGALRAAVRRLPGLVRVQQQRARRPAEPVRRLSAGRALVRRTLQRDGAQRVLRARAGSWHAEADVHDAQRDGRQRDGSGARLQPRASPRGLAAPRARAPAAQPRSALGSTALVDALDPGRRPIRCVLPRSRGGRRARVPASRREARAADAHHPPPSGRQAVQSRDADRRRLGQDGPARRSRRRHPLETRGRR